MSLIQHSADTARALAANGENKFEIRIRFIAHVSFELGARCDDEKFIMNINKYVNCLTRSIFRDGPFINVRRYYNWRDLLLERVHTLHSQRRLDANGTERTQSVFRNVYLFIITCI